MLKNAAKVALNRAGLFPVARAAYRRLNPSIALLRRREIRLYNQIIAPNSLVFDIGANLGQKSDIFLAAGFRTVIVEPNRYCQASLRFQFQNHARAVIIQKALGEKCGSATLYGAGSDAAASLLRDWNQQLYGKTRCIDEQVVETITLDAMIAEFGKPGYIKIDVEGFEYEVLLGLTQQVPLISFEFHAERIDTAKACITRLADLGALTFRPTDMFGRWLCPATEAADGVISFINSTCCNGDLYVWIK